MASRVYVLRHGETAWTLTGRHTSFTDVPLTANGESQAKELCAVLENERFAHILTSPLQRARHTCELAGLGARAAEVPDLQEWNYGDYEGQTTAAIRQDRPGWSVFRDGAPRGEAPANIRERADRVVHWLGDLDGVVAIFSHGQFLRALAMRWIGRPVGEGRNFVLDTASFGILGYEHPDEEIPAIMLWNAVPRGVHYYAQSTLC